MTVSDAMTAIEYQGCEKENYLGFDNDSGDTLQFVRVNPDQWMVSVPVILPKKGYSGHSLKAAASTAEVRQIVQLYLEGGEWKNVVELEDMKD